MSDTQSHSGALAGKVAIVTGASQGLGEAIARELTARGLAGLILTGRNSERGEAVAGSLKAAGCDARFLPSFAPQGYFAAAGSSRKPLTPSV